MKSKNDTPIKSAGRPKRNDKDNATASNIEKGTKPGEGRKAYILSIELTSKVDAIAFWDGKNIKDVATEALSDYVTKWEKKNGMVKMPGRKN